MPMHRECVVIQASHILLKEAKIPVSDLTIEKVADVTRVSDSPGDVDRR